MPIYAQAHCNTCNVEIGWSGQGPAYSGSDGFWYCERHIDAMWKRKVDEAQLESKWDQKRRLKAAR